MILAWMISIDRDSVRTRACTENKQESGGRTVSENHPVRHLFLPFLFLEQKT